ncbi:putative uncharacterized protein DDB_G0292636 [Ambystoma mexicanum]|uniref:putative uncharacterized protein DDB_G0292636 n=1 Tax=Ambystoma mexicanum TaxID=8296 RepID=UPI0037E74C5C
MKHEIKKDEGLYPLRELKVATGYSNLSYDSPTQSSDEGLEKDTEKDITSKVPRDKERRDKERNDQASASLDIRREIKRWKGDKDKTDEIALLQNKWLGGQILLKLDGKNIEDVRQRGDQDKQDRKDKKREERLKDEGEKRKDRQRQEQLYQDEQAKKQERAKKTQ